MFNTKQAKVLEGYDSYTITVEAALGVLDAAGIAPTQIDGILGQFNTELAYLLRVGPAWVPAGGFGSIPQILDAANAIAAGNCTAVLIAGGGAGIYTERSSTAPWTRMASEFVLPFGIYTALEFALIARRHMHMYGTTPEQMAEVAATIRNNGHFNPEAIYYGKGPFTASDVLESRMVADPFHLLDCSLTGEGGCALLLTRADIADDLRQTPVYILGGGADHNGPSYQHPPSWDLRGNAPNAIENGYVGQRAARQSFAMAGLTRPTSTWPSSMTPSPSRSSGNSKRSGSAGAGRRRLRHQRAIRPDGALPITTDGGLMSFSHGGGSVQLLQRVIRAVQQLQGTCATTQIAGAEVAIASNGGAARCSTTSCCSGATGHDDARAAERRHSPPPPFRAVQGVLGRVRGGPAALPTVCTLRVGRLQPRAALPDVPLAAVGMAGERRTGRDLQLVDRVPADGGQLHGALCADHRRPRRGYQMVSNLVGCTVDTVAIGLRVRVDFHEVAR